MSKKNYYHKDYLISPKAFDKKVGVITNFEEQPNIGGKIQTGKPYYSIIFEIPGYDFSEMITRADYDNYKSKFLNLLDHLVLPWNIIGVNKTIDFSPQIDSWTKSLERAKVDEIAKVKHCQKKRNEFISLARYYQEPFDFIEIFSPNKSTLEELHKILPQSKEMKIRKITTLEEIIKIKKAIYNPLGTR